VAEAAVFVTPTVSGQLCRQRYRGATRSRQFIRRLPGEARPYRAQTRNDRRLGCRVRDSAGPRTVRRATAALLALVSEISIVRHRCCGVESSHDDSEREEPETHHCRAGWQPEQFGTERSEAVRSGRVVSTRHRRALEGHGSRGADPATQGDAPANGPGHAGGLLHRPRAGGRGRNAAIARDGDVQAQDLFADAGATPLPIVRPRQS